MNGLAARRGPLLVSGAVAAAVVLAAVYAGRRKPRVPAPSSKEPVVEEEAEVNSEGEARGEEAETGAITAAEAKEAAVPEARALGTLAAPVAVTAVVTGEDRDDNDDDDDDDEEEEPTEMLSLVHDYEIGAAVVAQINFKEICVGDVGTVVAACGSDASRVKVQWGGGKGQSAWSRGQQIARQPLIKGSNFVIGDVVTTSKPVVPGRLARQLRGIVSGLCTDTTRDHWNRCVLVEFAQVHTVVACNVDTELWHAPLVEGSLIAKGDEVRAYVEFNGVAVGDRGVVIGPNSSASLDSAASRVLVDFGLGKRFNYTRAQLDYAPLCTTDDESASFAKEDKVEVKAADDRRGLVAGQRGLVVASAKFTDKSSNIHVDFGNTKVFDMAIAHLDHAPIVPGHPFKKGDRVEAKVDYKNIKIGHLGTVLGGCDRVMNDRDEQRLCIYWDTDNSKTNWLAGKHVGLAMTSSPQ